MSDTQTTPDTTVEGVVAPEAAGATADPAAVTTPTESTTPEEPTAPEGEGTQQPEESDDKPLGEAGQKALDRIKEEVKTLKAQLAEAKNGTADKAEFDKVTSERDDLAKRVAEFEKQSTVAARKEEALAALTEAGATKPKLGLRLLSDQLATDTPIAELIAGLKADEDLADIFSPVEPPKTPGLGTPGAGGNTPPPRRQTFSKEDIAKMTPAEFAANRDAIYGAAEARARS